jgi:hypothetical protein
MRAEIGGMRDPSPAIRDGNMGPRFHSQSLGHLGADAGHIDVRLGRAEDNLAHRPISAGKEDSPHQSSDLLAGKLPGIPILRSGKADNLRRSYFLP